MSITKLKPNFVYMNSIFFWLVVSFSAGYLQFVYVFELAEIKAIHFLALGGAGFVFGLLTAGLIVAYRLKKSNIRDPLTPSFNRTYYEEKLENWYEAKVNFSLILLDVDYFKTINSTYGRKTGDNVLIGLCDLINETKRSYDIFARHSDGTFVLMVPRNNVISTSKIASRLCEKISHTPMPSGVHVTCSFGVAQFRPESDTPGTLFERADEALHKSKDKGRNRVNEELATT